MKICYKKFWVIFLSLFVLFLCFNVNSLHAQNREFHAQDALKNSQKIQKTGMIVLGSWATLNIISGTVGFYSVRGDHKYFHQMNAFWNVVNLGIAGFGYNGASNLDLRMNYEDAISEMQSFERILLINAGLDLAYIGTGIWLWNRGLRKGSDRQVGYGKSLILQGGFLLAFDLALYAIHSPRTQELLRISDQLSFNGSGFTFSF